MLQSIASGSGWDMWDQFREFHMEPSGRIVDWQPDPPITTSEAQSYGLFFALVADDKESFKKILDWTNNNLAFGKLGDRLPAWKWGPKKGALKEYQVLDPNNATDSDLWMTYSLLEAGRIWNNYRYKLLGLEMMHRLKQEVFTVKGIGKVLPPASYGFKRKDGVLLNPSYHPMFIFKRFSQEDPFWKVVVASSEKVLKKSSPQGIAPDWIFFDTNGTPHVERNPKASYDAIRVYLWLSLLSPEDPLKDDLRGHFYPILKLAEKYGNPPQKINLVDKSIDRYAPKAFNAAVLGIADSPLKEKLRESVESQPLDKKYYFHNVLKLFGLGHDSGKFGIDRNGRLWRGTPDANG